MFTKLLKEVARGKRGARDLNFEEAVEAAHLILEQKASPAQIGAFLVALRIKMESIAEIEAFVVACRNQAFRSPVHEGMDCTGPYNGRTKSFFASYATAFVIASAGLPVTLHGSATLPPKKGITIHDILTASGVNVAQMSKERSIDIAKQTGVLFVPSEQWSPALASLRPIREELDMRTILNTVEKLIDYAHSPYLVFGVFHNTVFNKMSELLQHLGYRKSLIVQGIEGSEDLFIDRPTRVFFVESGHSELLVIDPSQYGLQAVPDNIQWTAEAQLQATEAVLQGEGHQAFTNQVLLNAATRLWLAGRVDSIEQGLSTIKPLLQNGDAWNLYTKWKHQMIN